MVAEGVRVTETLTHVILGGWRFNNSLPRTSAIHFNFTRSSSNFAFVLSAPPEIIPCLFVLQKMYYTKAQRNYRRDGVPRWPDER